MPSLPSAVPVRLRTPEPPDDRGIHDGRPYWLWLPRTEPESEDWMSPAALGDVGRMAGLLASFDGVDGDRICVRGSIMGGYLAIHAAATEGAIAGVIAVCPATEEGLRRGLRDGDFEMREAQSMAWQTLPVTVTPVLPGTVPVLRWFAAEQGFAGSTHPDIG